jgi:hypothetical protein
MHGGTPAPRSAAVPLSSPGRSNAMRIKSYRSDELLDDDTGAVGIVVQGARLTAREPSTLAFVWGREVNPAPSLPFGRWKPAFRAA